MVEISYGMYSEQADLAGKSVAEAREQYKPMFDIPDKAKAYLSGERAQAYLNRKQVKKDLEPETKLSDEDKLSFAEKSRRGLFMIGALLLALAVTGGTFAFGALTQTIDADVTPSPDFAALTVGADTPTWTTWGGFAGKIVAADQVFKITPADQFTGDFVVQIYLTNVETVSEVYRALGMRFTVICDVAPPITAVTLTPSVGFLSLQNPVTEIEVKMTGTPDGADFLDVKLVGGFYKANFRPGGGWTADAEDPSIYCQILQKGAP